MPCSTRPPHDWGLVDEVVEPDRLFDRALGVARDMATIPAGAFRTTKRLMRAPAVSSMDEAERTESEALLRVWTEPATLDAVRAYVERTLRPRKG